MSFKMKNPNSGPAQADPASGKKVRREKDRVLYEITQTNVPALARNVRTVLSLCSNPTADALEFSMTILNDYGMSLRFLRVLNSAFFSPGRIQVLSMRYIVVLLGIDNIAKISRSIPVVSTDGASGRLLKNSASGHLIGCSVLAGCIANNIAAFTLIDSQKLAACSMFQSLGDVSMAIAMPKVYEVLWKMRQYPSSADRMSKRLTGWTPTQLGIILARRWNLPVLLKLSIAMPREKLSELRPERKQAVSISTGLQTLLFYAGIPNAKNRQEKIREELKELLQIDEKQFSMVIQKGLSMFEKNNPFLYEILWTRGVLARILV